MRLLLRYLVIFLVLFSFPCHAGHKHKHKGHKKNKSSKVHSEVNPLIDNAEFFRRLKDEAPPQWMLEQINEDLTSFYESGVSTGGLDRLMLLDTANGSPRLLERVRVLNNQVEMTHHSSTHPAASPRIGILVGAIKKLAQGLTLPDVDFIITMHDALDNQELSVPVFAFAKKPNLSPKIILIPDFESLGGREALIREVHKANAEHPWFSKLYRSVWRGSRTGGDFTLSNFLEFPRSKAVTLSLMSPRLIDARFETPDQKDPQLRAYPDYFGNRLSIKDQIKYKYQLLIDGNSCAYSGGFWRLFSNCVILKQSSESIQWYYRAIHPNVHFLPVNSDMSNLAEVIQWAMAHDEETKKVSEQAQAFANENLTDFRILQYLYHLLLGYAKLPRH